MTTAASHGARLDKALTDNLAVAGHVLSRVRVQSLIAAGMVKRQGAPVTDASLKVKEGENYHITLPPPVPAKPEAQAIDLTVVFEDKDIIVIDKPVGLVVHPAPGNRDRTLVNALLAHCGDSLSGIGGVARPGIVHRLDKDTSGLMVVAKHDAAHRALAQQFADRSLSRTYQALVWGTPAPARGRIEAPIGRDTRNRKRMTVTGKGKGAATQYRVLKQYGPVSLVECTLETGRTHQIRVHMAYRKHPVVGDALYGGRNSRAGGKAVAPLLGFPRQALHAVGLHFEHPRTGKMMRFSSELPEDMRGLLKTLTPR